MTETFCILPWIHLILLPDGLLRVCCVAGEYIKKNGVPMSVYHYPVEEIWNSEHMRSVRRRMLQGRSVPGCTHCYLLEKTSGSSYRIQSNTRWSAKLGRLFHELVNESTSLDFAVPRLPLYLQLVPGNSCNLKCRMCSPLFSSQIEKDDVHRRWSPKLTEGTAEFIDWTQDQVSIGPQLKQGIDITGVHSLEIHDNRLLRWTDGDATFRLSVPSHLQAKSVLLKIGGYHPDSHHLRVQVNDRQLYEGVLSGKGFQQEFDIPYLEGSDPLTIRLLSDRFRNENDPRDLGVPIETIKLSVRNRSQRKVPHSPRMPAQPWFKDRSWVFGELLRQPDRLRSLYLTGGEPMIQRQVEEIINYLTDQQVAGNITLEFNINCTVLRDSLLKKLGSFKEVHFGLSIDAYGPYNEYIRYPSKWKVINKNISRLVELSGDKFALHAVPLLQVYNALNIVDLLTFFDHSRVPYRISVLSYPWFLSIGALPARARQIAASRLRAYSKTELCHANREHVLSIADQIESVPDNCRPELLQALMLFTNDLDATRGQDFGELHNELLSIIREDGFHWTQERRFRELEDDRVAWIQYMEALSQELKRSEKERILLTRRVENLTDQLEESEADRAARLGLINYLQDRLKVSEADRIARGKLIDQLSGYLKESEADRAARLEVINKLVEQIKESEDQRGAMLQVIQEQEQILTGPFIRLLGHRRKSKKNMRTKHGYDSP